MRKEQQELYDKFVNYVVTHDSWSKWQVDRTIEEAAELILSLCHLRRKKNKLEDVISEIADIENMIGQIKAIYKITDDQVNNERIEKIKRTLDLHKITLTDPIVCPHLKGERCDIIISSLGMIECDKTYKLCNGNDDGCEVWKKIKNDERRVD